ncbi:MAG: hypothetical protein Q7U04_13305 [Bacteriovorax sp.]|nr:hypothetical protein [Bacteriovorax sp.]
MKKRSASPLLITASISLIIMGILAYTQSSSISLINDNKSKLTLKNIAKNTATKVPVLKTLLSNNIAKKNVQAEFENNQQNILTKERIYTEQEINEMSEVQFQNLLQDTKLKFPKISEIKKLPAEALHQTPAVIIEAGRNLGVIKEVLKNHEPYEKIASSFYKNCAKDSEGTTPVRALCLANLIELKKKNSESLDLKDYPNHLIELSRMVTGI